MVAAVGLFLGEDGTIGVVRGIGLQAELSVGICVDKDRSLRNAPLKKFEGRLLIFGPLPGLTVNKKTDSQKVKFCLQVKLWPKEQRYIRGKFKIQR